MPAPSLQPTLISIMVRVAHFLGYGRDTTKWTSDQNADMNDIIESGLRQFYFPPPVSKDKAPYEWSFLRKVAIIVLADTEFSKSLPADFGGITKGTMTIINGGPTLRIIPDEELRTLLNSDTNKGTPRYAAIHPTDSDGTTAQGHTILFYPISDGPYTIDYEYIVAPSGLAGANDTPLGGVEHGETIVASCLAAAELLKDDERGIHYTRFAELLAGSIEVDKRTTAVSEQTTWPIADETTAGGTLEANYETLTREIANLLGYGFDRLAWSHKESSLVDSILQRGLRRFYFPPPTGDKKTPHEWSFLRKVVQGSSVAGQPTVNLPTDFGGIIGDTLSIEGTGQPIDIVSDETLRPMYEASHTSGAPKYASLRPLPDTKTWELVLYPTPSARYDFWYEYSIVPTRLSAGGLPLGGAQHAEAVLEACLAVAEQYLGKGKTDEVHHSLFLQALDASIEIDKAANRHELEKDGTWPIADNDAGGLDETYVEISREVANLLGYGFNRKAWTHRQQALIDSIITRGVRQFTYPPTLPNQPRAHVWRFMRPTMVLMAQKTQTATVVTATFANGVTGFTVSTTMTLADGTDRGRGFEVYGFGYGEIGIVTAPQAFSANGDFSGSEGATLKLLADYILPTDFAGIDGHITLQENENAIYPIRVIGEGEMRVYQQQDRAASRPTVAAVRPRKCVDGVLQGQTFGLMVWPDPDKVYNLHFRYQAIPTKLSLSNTFPWGGAPHAETLLESCLAVAEQYAESPKGHDALFLRKLASSIDYDLNANRAEHYGYNSDDSDQRYPANLSEARRWGDVTYNGVLY